jgi:hypothetical protein
MQMRPCPCGAIMYAASAFRRPAKFGARIGGRFSRMRPLIAKSLSLFRDKLRGHSIRVDKPKNDTNLAGFVSSEVKLFEIEYRICTLYIVLVYI